MDWTTGLAWLAPLGRDGRQHDFDDADRAGMGTAFGLDGSMPPQSEVAGADPFAPEPSVWERRLAGRSRL